MVSKFKVSALNGDFRKVAKENEYIVKPVNSIKELDENVSGVFGTQRKLVKWLFNSDTNVGDINIYDTQQGGYVVAMLTSINEEGLMSNEKASISASPILNNCSLFSISTAVCLSIFILQIDLTLNLFIIIYL